MLNTIFFSSTENEVQHFILLKNGAAKIYSEMHLHGSKVSDEFEVHFKIKRVSHVHVP